jgi:putative transposase
VLFAFAYLLLRRLFQLVASSSSHLSSDVEVVVLRHQLMVLKRKAGRPRLRRRDRLFMAAMSKTLPRARWSSFVVSPQTLLRWHRELVRRKWTFRRTSVGGRPPITDEVRPLIVRMGRDNPRWGCLRIRGELAKLGIRVSATRIRTLLRGNGLGPRGVQKHDRVLRPASVSGLRECRAVIRLSSISSCAGSSVWSVRTTAWRPTRNSRSPCCDTRSRSCADK